VSFQDLEKATVNCDECGATIKVINLFHFGVEGGRLCKLCRDAKDCADLLKAEPAMEHL
jgi:hypothetical protein